METAVSAGLDHGSIEPSRFEYMSFGTEHISLGVPEPLLRVKSTRT